MKTTKILQDILKEESGIKHQIAQDALDYSDEPEDQASYLRDVCMHGCQSGIVTSLIYYEDTNSFYDEFETEIWDILETQAEDFGQSVFEMIDNFNGAEQVHDLKTFKNLLAWYAYEETAREVLELDLEEEL